MTRRRRRRPQAVIGMLIFAALAAAGAVAFWALQHGQSRPPADSSPTPATDAAEDFSAAERRALEGILKRQGSEAQRD